MTAQKQKAARELLELEQLYQKGIAFDDRQSQRWHELVANIFGPENAAHARRSFRLPSQVPCTVRIGQGKFECTALEISRMGLTLEGPVLRHITHDHQVEVVSTVLDGKAAALNLICTVARLEPAKDPPRAGLVFAAETASNIRQRFFDVVYYPQYLRHLEHLTQKTGSR